ncbi:MAG: hypothetical protein QXO27_03415 [Candidatus Aenigmatarchaeota archaeon]
MIDLTTEVHKFEDYRVFPAQIEDNYPIISGRDDLEIASVPSFKFVGL